MVVRDIIDKYESMLTINNQLKQYALDIENGKTDGNFSSAWNEFIKYNKKLNSFLESHITYGMF